MAEADAKAVATARFPVIFHTHPESYGKTFINRTFPTDVPRVWKCRIEEIARNICALQVTGRIGAVIKGVHFAPKRAILASPMRAEVYLRARVADYPSTAGYEIARGWNKMRAGHTRRQQRH